MTAPASRQGGQATVEVVLALPVVVLLLLLVIQVGLVAQAKVVAVNAAREGARAAAIEGSSSAANRAARSSPGLRRGAPVAVHAEVGAAEGDVVRVRVAYRVETDVPLVGALVGDVTVRGEVAMRREAE